MRGGWSSTSIPNMRVQTTRKYVKEREPTVSCHVSLQMDPHFKTQPLSATSSLISFDNSGYLFGYPLLYEHILLLYTLTFFMLIDYEYN